LSWADSATLAKGLPTKTIYNQKNLEKLGIVYSLNPYITLGHGDRGRNACRQIPGIVTIVGHDGAVSSSCACPLSIKWQENTIAAWTMYAETEPHVLWIEDDIRTFNHGIAHYGCFCELHMTRFSDLVGKKIYREDLVEAILSPGHPHPWRKLYLDMQSEIMNNTVSLLSKTVHTVSPETCMGLMSSGPENHCVEGRKWDEFALALRNGRQIYSRPPMGNYSENNLRDLTDCPQSIKITRYCMPKDAIEQLEIENSPFTPYSKSAVFTFLQMAISFAFGSQGVTLNLFDHMGTSMKEFSAYGKMLSVKKAYLSTLKQYTNKEGSFKGIRLLHSNDSSYRKVLEKNSLYSTLTEDGRHGAIILEKLGISCDYNNSNVIFACGQTIRSFSDEEIKIILSKGVLLDALAAIVLVERGFGKEIGLKSIDTPKKLSDLGPFSAEEYYNKAFGGCEKKFMTLTFFTDSSPAVSKLTLLHEANIVSVLADPDAKRHDPLSFTFENSLGGRVAVLAFDIAYCRDGFFNPIRRDFFHHLVSWLNFGKPDLLVSSDSGFAMCFRKDCSDYTIVGAFNLSLDPAEKFILKMSYEKLPKCMKILNDTGQWEKSTDLIYDFQNGILKIKYNGPINYHVPLICMIY